MSLAILTQGRLSRCCLDLLQISPAQTVGASAMKPNDDEQAASVKQEIMEKPSSGVPPKLPAEVLQAKDQNPVRPILSGGGIIGQHSRIRWMKTEPGDENDDVSTKEQMEQVVLQHGVTLEVLQ